MKIFFYFILTLLPYTGFATEQSPLIEENDFQQLSQQMKEKNRGLLLMFHAEHCPYCARMEKEILAPMVISGEYDDRIFIRKLQIDEARNIKDFEGKTVEPSDVSDKYKARLTPTLVFLDHKGEEKAKKMVGINTVELFGAYLDAEIDQLMQNL
jgi:thioredoxin-related protein